MRWIIWSGHRKHQKIATNWRSDIFTWLETTVESKSHSSESAIPSEITSTKEPLISDGKTSRYGHFWYWKDKQEILPVWWRPAGKFSSLYSMRAYSWWGWISGRKSTRDVRLDCCRLFGMHWFLPEFGNQTTQFLDPRSKFVHIDANGNPATPLYDYLKPFLNHFWENSIPKMEGKMNFLQGDLLPSTGDVKFRIADLFLKYAKPEKFKNVSNCFHLPQYVSFLFTGERPPITPASVSYWTLGFWKKRLQNG